MLLPDRLFEALSCLIRPSRLAALLSIPVVIFYTIMTGSRTSTIRACIIVTLYFLSLLFERRKTLWRPLFLAAFCILLWQPSAIFRVDFQLTFLASAGVIFMFEYLKVPAPPLNAFFTLPFSPSPPPPLPPSPLQRLLISLRRFFLLSCCLSLAAFLMASPLTAYFFNLISPVGIFTNLAATPLVAGILYTGMGAILMIPFWPGLASILFRFGALLRSPDNQPQCLSHQHSPVILLSSIPTKGTCIHHIRMYIYFRPPPAILDEKFSSCPESQTPYPLPCLSPCAHLFSPDPILPLLTPPPPSPML